VTKPAFTIKRKRGRPSKASKAAQRFIETPAVQRELQRRVMQAITEHFVYGRPAANEEEAQLNKD
jgi:hypothetical protein